MTRSKLEVQETVAPNLIPMIDIMFLLLLFFMLGADMGQRELEEVKLPQAEKSEEDPGREERLIINIHHDTDRACIPYASSQVCRETGHWRIGIRGKDCTGGDALAVLLTQEAGLKPGDSAPSTRKVMIRSDARSPYGMTQRVITSCAHAGIYQVQVGAARRM